MSSRSNQERVIQTDRFVATSLKPENQADIQRLLESCSDYFELVFGRAPGPAEAQALFLEGPEDGQPPEGKQLFGIWSRQKELIGILDAFVDYPESGVWYIGLLVLDPRARKGGLGREILETFAAEWQNDGAREIQINVVEQNQAALRFWTRAGFSEVRRWLHFSGRRESTFIRMRRPIDT